MVSPRSTKYFILAAGGANLQAAENDGGDISESPGPGFDLLRWRDRVPVDWLTKVLALAGGALYGVLFVAYRLYYAALDLRPEDGGITSAFLAPRAIGMALVFLSLSCCLAVFFYLYVLYESVTHSSLLRLISHSMGFPGGYLLYKLFDSFYPQAPRITLAASMSVVVGIFLYGWWASGHTMHSPKRQRNALKIAVAVAIFAAFIVPIVAVWAKADEYGSLARQGSEVRPYQPLGLPVLDVRTYHATLRWTGADHAWPPEPFGEGSKAMPVRVLVLAQDGATVTVLAGEGESARVLRLNAPQVSLSYSPTRA